MGVGAVQIHGPAADHSRPSPRMMVLSYALPGAAMLAASAFQTVVESRKTSIRAIETMIVLFVYMMIPPFPEKTV